MLLKIEIMTTNNNCIKEDSIDDLTAAMGKCKLEGSRKRDTDDNISDDELFKQPPPKEDCPICLLPLPFLHLCTNHVAEKLFAVAVVLHPCTII